MKPPLCFSAYSSNYTCDQDLTSTGRDGAIVIISGDTDFARVMRNVQRDGKGKVYGQPFSARVV